MKDFDRNTLMQKLQDGVHTLQLQHISPTKIGQLIDYLALLSKWNAVYNLTSVREPEQMVVQHLLDSLAVVPAFFSRRNVLDVGAGGGLPGMVLAIVYPEMPISLIDTVHKKTAFLMQVKMELNLSNVTVYTGRVEQLQVTQKFDVITSRAFAELADFVAWSNHLLEADGQFIALKGMVPHEEIARLPRAWQVMQVQPLQVPNLNAERHLIFIKEARADNQ